MTSSQWSNGGEVWVARPPNLRSGSALALRESWIRLALLSGDDPDLAVNGRCDDLLRRHPQAATEEADELLSWIFVLGLMTVLYTLSRYMSRRVHETQEADNREHGGVVVRPARNRPSEPTDMLRRIDTWSPAKPYAAFVAILQTRSCGPISGPGAEIEMVETCRPHGVGAASSDKDSFRDYVESGCAICFEEFIPSSLVRVLPCRHVFHRNCLDTWFRRSALCPLCMYDYTQGPRQPARQSSIRQQAASGERQTPAEPGGRRVISFGFLVPERLRRPRAPSA